MLEESIRVRTEASHVVNDLDKHKDIHQLKRNLNECLGQIVDKGTVQSGAHVAQIINLEDRDLSDSRKDFYGPCLQLQEKQRGMERGSKRA